MADRRAIICNMPAKKPPHAEFLLSKSWTDDKRQKWTVNLRFTFDSRGLRCTAIGMSPASVKTAPPTITTRALQRLPLRKWTDELAVAKSKQLQREAPAAWAPISRKLEQLAQSRRGPRASSSAFYTDVAAVYRQAITENQSPTKAVAERWSVTRTLAATWVHRARKAGQLSETSQGQARG
jgi:hypothetical protein